MPSTAHPWTWRIPPWSHSGWTTWRRPLVVNCAAYTAVDRAEDEPEAARRTNAEAPGVLGAACDARGIGIVHLSTDYVFDGAKRGAYLEQDAARPLGVYGATKLAGEEALRAATPRHLILRVSWVFGHLGRSFVDTILRLARERRELAVVDDQVGTPSPATAIAEAVRQIAFAVAAREDAWGTYHFSATPPLSWCAFARAIVAVAAETGLLDSPPPIRAIGSERVAGKGAATTQFASRRQPAASDVRHCASALARRAARLPGSVGATPLSGTGSTLPWFPRNKTRSLLRICGSCRLKAGAVAAYACRHGA